VRAFAHGAAPGGIVIALEVLGRRGIGATGGTFAPAATKHDEEKDGAYEHEERNEVEVGMHGKS